MNSAQRTDKTTGRATGKRQELSLRELVEFASETSVEVFARDGQHHPVWMIVFDDGEMHVMPTPFNNAREKRTWASALRSAFKEFRVKRFVFICEMWAYSLPADTKEIDLNTVTPASEHPDRQECILISGEDVNGEAMMVMRRIIREPGKPPRLAEPNEADQGFSPLAGVFENMLGVPRVKN